MNLYGFVGNGPMNGVDAWGLAWYNDWHYDRNENNGNVKGNLPGSPQDANDKGWQQLPTSESVTHMLNNQWENVKYISPDGKLEAVYNSNGNLVEDDLNKGTYNYCPPKNKFGHLIYDVIPWLEWGNSENDPSSMTDRLMMLMLGGSMMLF